MRVSWSTVECSWLGRPPSGRPAIDRGGGWGGRFPKFHQKQSPVYCCRLLIVHEQVTSSAPPLIWKSYPAHYPTDSLITLFILCLSLSLLLWKRSCCSIWTFLPVSAGGEVGLMEGRGSETSPRLKLSERSSLWLCPASVSEMDLWVQSHQQVGVFDKRYHINIFNLLCQS